MGYLFVTLFCFRRQAPRLAMTGGCFGLAYGSLVGTARMVQGAHFPTDVLWALGLIGMTATCLHYFVLPTATRWWAPLAQMRPRRRRAVSAILLVIVLVITGLFLTRRPYFKTFRFDLPLPPEIRSIELSTELPLSRQQVTYGPHSQGRLRVHASGFGWVAARCRVALKPRLQDGNLLLHLTGKPDGYFSELSYEIEWLLPTGAQGMLDLPGGD